MDTNICGGTVSLLSLDPLNVDPELASVALDDLADLKQDYNNLSNILISVTNEQKAIRLEGPLFVIQSEVEEQ